MLIHELLSLFFLYWSFFKESWPFPILESKNVHYHMSWDKKKLSGKQETIIIIHVELRWKSQSFFKGSQVSSSRKLRLRKLRPRKLRPLDKAIAILKRCFESKFIYDNVRDAPQVSNHSTNPRPVKGFVYFYSKQERRRQDRCRRLTAKLFHFRVYVIHINVRIVGFLLSNKFGTALRISIIFQGVRVFENWKNSTLLEKWSAVHVSAYYILVNRIW